MSGLQKPFILAGDFPSPHDGCVADQTESKVLVFGGVDEDTAERLMKRLKHPCGLLQVFATGLLLGAVGVSMVPLRGETYPSVAPPATTPAQYFAAKPLNNSCLIDNLKIPDGPQTFDACAFVIRSTDEVWNLRGDVTAAIEKYFHEDYVNAGSWGRRAIGKEALRKAVLAEMRAFPDIKIHITDCMCKGNDFDGYKCAMPDILDGTNTGPSVYGPATGKYARWTGLVQSLVKKNARTGQWQYVAEWGVHDEWALIQQLGLDFRKVPHPKRNNEPLHDCKPLLSFHPSLKMDSTDERDKQLHRQAIISADRASLRAGMPEKHP